MFKLPQNLYINFFLESILRIQYGFGRMRDKRKNECGIWDMGKNILARKGFAHFDRQDVRYFNTDSGMWDEKMKNNTFRKFCRELQLLPGGVQINILCRFTSV